MGTGNFFSRCGRYFVVDLPEPELYREMEQEIVAELKQRLPEGAFIDEADEWDGVRSFAGHIFANVEIPFACKDYDSTVRIQLIARSGYYSAANLDYVVGLDDIYHPFYYFEEGIEEFDISELPKRIQKKVNKVLNEIERVFGMFSEEYRVAARFSNGETWYEPVRPAGRR